MYRLVNYSTKKEAQVTAGLNAILIKFEMETKYMYPLSRFMNRWMEKWPTMQRCDINLSLSA